jgi:competence protein ComEC
MILEWPKFRTRKRLLILSFVLVNVLVWRSVWDVPKLRWIQFDVRQADSALLLLPRGHAVLVDTGARNPFSNDGKRVVLPCLRRFGIRKLDAVILSHGHDDHAGGLPAVLSEGKATELLMPEPISHFGLMDTILESAAKSHTSVRIVRGPDSLVFPGCRIDLLGPASEVRNENERSLLARVVFSGNRLLFLGDAETAQNRFRGLWTKPCDGLKVAHHGAKGSAGENRIEMARPCQAVISVGKNNRFGHPSAETIAALQSAGADVHRTDREAALWFESDGDSLRQVDWIKRESPLVVFLGLNRY